MARQVYKSDDAHLYWCPHAWVGVYSGRESAVAVNRFDEGRGAHTEQRCLGASCSQWEWEDKPTDRGRCGHGS